MLLSSWCCQESDVDIYLYTTKMKITQRQALRGKTRTELITQAGCSVIGYTSLRSANAR